MRRGIQIGAAVVAITVVAYLGYMTLRQDKGPSGASTPSTMAELPPIQRNEVTITCGPEIVGARGDLFGTSMYMPRWIGAGHTAVDWEPAFLDFTEDALREHIKLVGPRTALRFGHQPFDGYFDAQGKLVTGYHWRDALEAGSDQMSIDDFMAYARRVNAEPQVVTNFGTGTAKEAGDFVAYTNGTDESDPLVALRKRRGNPDPFAVKIWEIGNEPWGDWTPGHERFPDSPGGSRDAQDLGRRQAEFATSMRGRSPTPIKLYAPITSWELDSYSESDLRRLTALTAPAVDGYAVHFYASSEAGQSTESVAQRAVLLGERLDTLRRLIDGEGEGKVLDIAVTEWAGSPFPSPMGRNWLTGLVLADSALVMAERGVASSNYFAAASAPGDAGGYSYWLDADPERPAPVLVTTQVLARHLGRELLETRTEGVQSLTVRGKAGNDVNYSALGARCSRRDYDVGLIVVNRTPKPRQSNIALEFNVIAPIQQTQLVAPTGAETVDAAVITYQPSTKFSLDLPPYSVTFLRIPAT